MSTARRPAQGLWARPASRHTLKEAQHGACSVDITLPYGVAVWAHSHRMCGALTPRAHLHTYITYHTQESLGWFTIIHATTFSEQRKRMVILYHHAFDSGMCIYVEVNTKLTAVLKSPYQRLTSTFSSGLVMQTDWATFVHLRESTLFPGGGLGGRMH